MVETVAAATALRWSRPDLTAALAGHLMEAASAVSDRDGWLVAAGWRVHAVAATGDAREVAAEVLEALPRWDGDALSGSASQRLRLELAGLAHDVGEHGVSQTLLEEVSRGVCAGDAGLAAEVATARLRCRHDHGPCDPADALAAWGRVGGAAGETGAATVLLVAAAADRRNGRVGSAVTRAVEGLARLDRARNSARALSPSPHLAAALAAEWISALIAAGRSDQSRDGSRPLRERLVEYARPTRQLALLRLTLARAAAEHAPHDGADAAKELERAAHDAAASDAPELEYICRTALGEVHETGGRLESALESVRLAVVAERRHRSRTVRFLAALAATPGLGAGDPATGAAPTPGSGTPGPRTPLTAEVEPPGRDAPSGTVRSPDNPDRTGTAPAGSAERTAILRSVQAASVAHPRPGGGAPRRGPVAADGDPGRGAKHNDSPAGADRSPSSGPARAPERAAANCAGATAANGAARTGAGTNPPGPRPNRVNGSGVRPDGVAGTDGNGANGHASRRPGPGPPDCGVDRPGVNGGATNSGAAHASGRALPRVSPDPVPAADEADPPVTAPMNPWATGVWTAGAPHAPEQTGGKSPAGRADSPAGDVPAADPAPASVPVPVPDPVASALADPEAWLASALADLDRIWGRSDGADDTTHDEADPPAAIEVPPAGCVVVLDLTRGGERLPAGEVASTVRRVARRLAQQLPESAHLLRDRPDAVSVVLADGDRVAAAEWMHRVVPALVDGLAVDAAVEGAHLRAAVHDVQGVVGAQVLQRLDGGRTRSARGGTPGRARHAAPGDIAADTTCVATSEPAARDDDGVDHTASRRASTTTSDTTDGRTIDGADGGATGSDTTRSGTAGGDLPVSGLTRSDATGSGLSGGDTTGSDTTGSDTTGSDATGSDATGSDATGSDATGSDATGGDTSGSDTTGGDATGSDTTGSDTSGSGLSGGGTTGGGTAGSGLSGGSTTGSRLPDGHATGGRQAGSDTTRGGLSVGDTTRVGQPVGDVTGGEVTGGEVTGGEVTGGEVTGGDVTGGEVTGGEVTGGGLSGSGTTGGGLSNGGAGGGGMTGTRAVFEGGPTGGEPIGATDGESPGTGSRPIAAAAPASSGIATPGAVEPPLSAGDRPTRADGGVAAGQGRHDEAAGRRPYLPDGVVVRPGTGGRRHRRSPDPTPDEPESEAAPPAAPAAQQSTEGLGLADLLAGALAAYRGI